MTTNTPLDDLEDDVENDFREMVDLVASGYEWACPSCDCYNTTSEVTTQVVCTICGEMWEVADYYHAIG